MNSVTVPRKPGEAVGGICKLAKEDGTALTINVEYNQLDPLLKETGEKKGDVPDPTTGNSKFPGNINVLVFKLDRFKEVLNETKGAMPEFVNPKYKDATKTAFKSPTRLECMMQDFPRLLKSSDKVGFTQLARWLCFSTVKNNVKDAAAKAKQGIAPEAAFSGESDCYSNAAKLLEIALKQQNLPCDIAAPSPCTFLDVDYVMGPHVVLLPSFAQTIETMKEKVKGPVKISGKSTLILEGDVTIEKGGLELDGALELRAAPGSKIVVDGLKVKNNGAFLHPSDENAPPQIAIRGYYFKKADIKSVFAKEGETVKVTE
uniref:Uncharacterized protein n=1 Tax=Chromera velia CCMP2878 TaxID=1169474 RepID=A0A0G4HQX2_9ALVE|eukprot:Cvel_30381.t1-p1 / transcript=Cvel_30381.t1 / gene=Cvel_30381 / organism=Chromera_velia_CCMP2878 / gene_product=UDP-sugar pyrophosphorylase, putative / transcript_product=UDP-sugar pyrophosphorylase, putative / location=Cvel_scaffold4321:5726-9257(-) / protein_length=316 / sequence_SO=supercontig / SO=protein_coding / is_pseudo=false